MFFGALGETSKITKVHNLLVIAFDFKDCHYNILIMFTKKKNKKQVLPDVPLLTFFLA